MFLKEPFVPEISPMTNCETFFMGFFRLPFNFLLQSSVLLICLIAHPITWNKYGGKFKELNKNLLLQTPKQEQIKNLTNN